MTVRPGDDPRITDAASELALLFWRRGEHERAKRLLREVLRARPGDEDLGTVLATFERLERPATTLGAAGQWQPKQLDL